MPSGGLLHAWSGSVSRARAESRMHRLQMRAASRMGLLKAGSFRCSRHMVHVHGSSSLGVGASSRPPWMTAFQATVRQFPQIHEPWCPSTRAVWSLHGRSQKSQRISVGWTLSGLVPGRCIGRMLTVRPWQQDSHSRTRSNCSSERRWWSFLPQALWFLVSVRGTGLSQPVGGLTATCRCLA